MTATVMKMGRDQPDYVKFKMQFESENKLLDLEIDTVCGQILCGQHFKLQWILMHFVVSCCIAPRLV